MTTIPETVYCVRWEGMFLSVYVQKSGEVEESLLYHITLILDDDETRAGEPWRIEVPGVRVAEAILRHWLLPFRGESEAERLSRDWCEGFWYEFFRSTPDEPPSITNHFIAQWFADLLLDVLSNSCLRYARLRLPEATPN